MTQLPVVTEVNSFQKLMKISFGLSLHSDTLFDSYCRNLKRLKHFFLFL
jgi:hypothetical protein